MVEPVAQNNDTNESILNSIKHLLGIMSDVTAFDGDIIIHINTAFSILASMGVGPKTGFKISSASDVWDTFLSKCTPGESTLYEDVKTWMYMKVKLMFDPPTNSPLLDSYNRMINEIEYRMYTQSGGY